MNENYDLENNEFKEDSFEFEQKNSVIFDKKFDTKPIGYLKDAWLRFKKNKGSVVAFSIIALLLLFAIFTPMISRYDSNYSEKYMDNVLPKSEFFSKFGIWNGIQNKTFNSKAFDYNNSFGSITKVKKEYEIDGVKYYDVKIDSYKKRGYVYFNFSKEEFLKLDQYQKEKGIQIIFPATDSKQMFNPDEANYWYKTNEKGNAVYKNGEYQDIYLRDENGNLQYYIEKDELRRTRVLYYEYYTFIYGKEASFLFGTDGNGYDILARLADGARLSFILAISVSVINLFLGMIYGAIEGYYGGRTDLIMERVSDVLSGVPFIVVVALFNLHIKDFVGVVPSLLFAFVLTGWIGTAAAVRSQFYRYKGQEYVLASRTLGAKDKRIIFRHILPNALGTLITSSVLVIPSVIFSESTLSYLNIIDLQSSGQTSIGTMLANGQSSLSDYPHIIFFPAVFISLLMIAFNLFGNGLRDAFNPSLRGAEE